jgi:hypothetical protein
MNDKNWLIRTTNFQILGPITKQKIIEVYHKGALHEDDELSQGNGYWFFVREKDLIEKYIIGNVPQEWSILSEAKNVLTAVDQDPLEEEENILESVSNYTTDTGATNLSKESSALPSNSDLEYPDMPVTKSVSKPIVSEMISPSPAIKQTTPKPKEVLAKVPDGNHSQMKLPDSNDLEYPDLPAPKSAPINKATPVIVPPKAPLRAEVEVAKPKLEVKFQRKTDSIKPVSEDKNDSYLFYILIVVLISIVTIYYYYKKEFLNSSMQKTSSIDWIIPSVQADVSEQESTPENLIDNLEGKKKVFDFPGPIVLENIRITPTRSIFGFEIDLELTSTSCTLASELWALKSKVFALSRAERFTELAALNKWCPITKDFFKNKSDQVQNDKKLKTEFNEFLKGDDVGLDKLVKAKKFLEILETNFNRKDIENQNTLFLYTLRAVVYTRINNHVAAARNISEFLKQGPYQIYFNSFHVAGRQDWSEILFAGIEYLNMYLHQKDLFLLYGEYLKNIIDQREQSEKISRIFPDINYKKIDQMINKDQSFKLFPSTWYFVLYQKKFRERANQLLRDWSNVMSNVKEKEKVLWTLPYWSANNPDALLLGWISGYDKMSNIDKNLAVELATVLPYKAIFEKIVPQFKKAHFQLARDFYSKSFIEKRPNIFFLYKLYSLGDKDLAYLDSLYNQYEKEFR